MTDRISELTTLTLEGKMYAEPIASEFDREDLFLPKQRCQVKRLCEFILNQEPVLTEYSTLTGFFNCNGSVVGDVFRRMGHEGFNAVAEGFYLKPIANLSTFEWQHATADYKKVLSVGFSGIIEEITKSEEFHKDPEEKSFLAAMKAVCNALIAWAEKCSKRALELSRSTKNERYAKNLTMLSEALLRVPKNKPTSFYEAVLTIYICFSADPDSLGTLDRYLTPFYENDIKNHVINRDEAKEYLQELFLMLQAATRKESPWFTRGGESHFCVGGYLENGEDGYNALSDLILEALTELPTWIPQVTLRWTKKMPHEVFYHVMDLERKDPNKRIAFQNDEKRIKCYTEICGFTYEQAVRYTTVGCNEPAFPGTISGASSIFNAARCVETLFHKRADELIKAESFEDFYRLFEEELKSDIDLAIDYDNKYNQERAKDINYLSAPFFQGCIKKAKSMTRGAGDTAVTAPSYIGIPNIIDSVIITKQFVYDEGYVTMQTLSDALKANWQGYEFLRALILKKGDFFGNDTERSNYVAQRIYNSLYEHLKDRKNVFGYHCLVGDLVGYNPHHKVFGEKMQATPDGRFSGDALKFGLGQSEGKDRNGLTALLNSIAKVDPNAIGCGSTVTNITLDSALVKDDGNFEKTVRLFETYFENGGVHFQLTYVSKEDLMKAKTAPEEYKNLRVRVSGFSDYFVKLNAALQDDVIERTVQK